MSVFRPLLLSLTLLLSIPALAAPLQMSISTVKPWGYLDKEGNPQGLLGHFSRELEKYSALPMNNVLAPYPRVIQEIKRGHADIAVLFKSPEADQYGIDLGEVVRSSIIVIARSDAPMISSISDLQNTRVGYIRGSRYGKAFDDNQTLYKVPVNDMSQGVKMLLQGRIEAMVSADYTLFFTLRELGIDPLRLAQLLVLSSNSGHLYLSRRSNRQEVLEPLQHALELMQEEGVLQRIFSKPYLSDTLQPPANDNSQSSSSPPHWLARHP
ncbi:substrate-binding periplasmic protein [Aestuariirhabdus sp. LZHN29]|uniref:substrate-binding periplasmic protein n=1 Tax=Aestuariirhabdus sp. LZHN29 TaxID=3417462 RepID=UPI003CEE6B81